MGIEELLLTIGLLLLGVVVWKFVFKKPNEEPVPAPGQVRLDTIVEGASGSKSGAVMRTPLGSGDTADFHPVNQIVELKAIPAVGFAFSHWAGLSVRDLNPQSVQADRDLQIYAYFIKQP